MTEIIETQMSDPNEQSPGLPVDREIIFTNHKNIYKKRIEKRQRKLLGKISFLDPFLYEGERIILVTKGCSPASIFEQLMTGWLVYYLKRSLLVFTNMRIFHIPTKPDYSYRNSIAQILYADCEKISLRGRTLTIRYKSGKKEKFFGIRSESKKIKSLLKTMPLEGEESQTLQRIHLCPRCTNELIQDEYVCPVCQFVFKDKIRARKISIIYPGGGYFYTRHPILGISDALTELLLMNFLILSLIDVVKGAEGSIPAACFLGMSLALEKVITVYHSNHFIKEYISEEKEIEPVTEFELPEAKGE